MMITAEELLEKYPECKVDLAYVLDDWMAGEPVEMRLERVPMTRFETFAKDMLATYPTSPKDRARTNKIIRLLKAGSKPLPIFCDTESQSDEQAYVMEGRHRIVAFLQCGFTEIEVVYVTKL